METFAAFQSRINRDRAARRAMRVALLRAMGGIPTPFAAPADDREMIVVHRDTYPETAGQWRVTRFDPEGPIGHFVCKSFSDAVDEARFWGAVLPLARSLRTF